ncbi:NAD-dependent epimerase/dehydratase family protein [Halopseudomonas laoshanensis]|uniref:NAD-dependent epimerase/dehydratase family protein n=1 Tax=Halopseudomonas laoshanensis TaxID=2268758 RepID=A0A7V7GN64_9GAMM|nr:NAD-dependent epimerase/dehydratase family protein [Halopseudomonas laoshanensis]KAA0690846.1 NAD-dependent epimerase/dehydratase family protein [Halopseudomonas laoshanensis]
MRVLITGANGFIGKNLQMRLRERDGFEVVMFTREHSAAELPSLLMEVDWVFHLAGVNRPQDPAEFVSGNVGLTQFLCEALKEAGRSIPVVYTSSIQAEQDNDYGTSKRDAEQALLELADSGTCPVYIYRLPNVFGKWARPDYNSAVATFCHNIARDIPVHVNDASAPMRLVYIDDVIASFDRLLDSQTTTGPFVVVEPVYNISVGELADQLKRFKATREHLVTEAVGTGLTRALYSTYVSYLPPELFTYTVPQHGDERGVFVEMLKTPDAGQFSFFTAHSGTTRGGHYHHSKTEKFLVIKGEACFHFRHMLTGEYHELRTSGTKPEIVETVPGWTHDITNEGKDELVCMLWANEIYDRQNPDTFACPVGTAEEAGHQS